MPGVDVGDLRVQGAQRVAFDASEITSLNNQARETARILIGFSLICLFSFLVSSVTLKTQADMNHQDYVANYFLY